MLKAARGRAALESGLRPRKLRPRHFNSTPVVRGTHPRRLCPCAQLRGQIRRAARGLTLIEIVVALGILSLISGAIYGIVSGAVESTTTLSFIAAEDRRTEAFLDRTRVAFAHLPTAATLELKVLENEPLRQELIIRGVGDAFIWGENGWWDNPTVTLAPLRWPDDRLPPPVRAEMRGKGQPVTQRFSFAMSVPDFYREDFDGQPLPESPLQSRRGNALVQPDAQGRFWLDLLPESSAPSGAFSTRRKKCGSSSAPPRAHRSSSSASRCPAVNFHSVSSLKRSENTRDVRSAKHSRCAVANCGVTNRSVATDRPTASPRSAAPEGLPKLAPGFSPGSPVRRSSSPGGATERLHKERFLSPLRGCADGWGAYPGLKPGANLSLSLRDAWLVARAERSPASEFPSARGASRFRRARGSSLLLVLWAIMLMSFAVIGLVAHLSRGVDESLYAEKEFRARLLLQSARVVAAHPDIEWGDPLLRQRVSSVSSYEITLTTEGVHLAINQIGVNPAQRDFARRLFEKWEMDSRKAETLADSIADWIDKDDRPRPSGAERDYYLPLGHRNFPSNRPFTDISDVMLVRGAEELSRVRPDWRRYFTLYGDGTIDVHRTSAEMLEVLFDVTPSEIGRFIAARRGPDGIADTIDDPRFTSLEQVRALLDVPPSKYNAVAKLLTLDHPVKRTECVAWAGSLARRLTIIKGPGIDFIREE